MITNRETGVCGHDFCYLCLANQKVIWRDGNSAHKTTCKHWREASRATLPGVWPDGANVEGEDTGGSSDESD